MGCEDATGARLAGYIGHQSTSATTSHALVAQTDVIP